MDVKYDVLSNLQGGGGKAGKGFIQNGLLVPSKEEEKHQGLRGA